jgi:hypothetical protein
MSTRDETLTASPDRNQRLKASIGSGLLSVVAFLAGLAVLFATFWFTYAVIWFGMLGVSAASELLFTKRLAISHPWRLALSSLFIALLFFGNARASREYLSDYSRRNYPGGGTGMQAGLLGSLVCLLAYPETSSKMISDLLFTGPRLVVYSRRMLARSIELIKPH